MEEAATTNKKDRVSSREDPPSVSMEAYREALFRSLQDLAEDPAFTDLILYLGQEEKGGHVVRTSRLLVGSLSQVFRTMLSHDMKERREGKLRLPTVSLETWNIISKFYFEGKKLVNMDNVTEIASVAHMFELTLLQRHCDRVVFDNITVKNCLPTLDAAIMFNLMDSKQKSLEFAMESFDMLLIMENSFTMTKDSLLELLSAPFLITTEDTLCWASLVWLTRNGAGEETAMQVFSKLKLQCLSFSYLNDWVWENPEVERHATMKVMVQKEVQERQALQRRSMKSSYLTGQTLDTSRVPVHSCAMSRTASASPALDHPYRRTAIGRNNILLLGVNQMDKYFLLADDSTVEHLPSMHIKRHSSSCLFKGCIYLTGGGGSSRRTFCFSLHLRQWQDGPDLLEGRSRHGMAATDKAVYAVMGCCCICCKKEEGLTSIEEFRPSTQKWTKVGNMRQGTFNCGVAVVGSHIIAVGGNYSCRHIIQTFNLLTSTATLLSETLPRFMVEVKGVSFGEEAIFVDQAGMVVRVSPKRDGEVAFTLGQLEDFPECSDFGLLVDQYHLMIFGGEASSRTLRDSVLCYTLDGGCKVNPEPTVLLPKDTQVCGVFRVDSSHLAPCTGKGCSEESAGNASK